MTLSLLLLAAFLANRISGECTFPDYLTRSNVVWDTKIEYARLMTGYTIQFHGSKMSVWDYTSWSSTKTVLYCEKRLRHGKYILRDNQSGGSTFSCVQFFKRSSYIVQRKVSSASSINKTDICQNDRLKLDNWPLVITTLAEDHNIPCPNLGGFNMKIHRKNSTTVECSWLSPPQRMESECLPGEGLRFNFRSSRCVGGSLMKDKQNLFCLGSWTDQKYRHTIATDGKELRPKVWLLRTPVRIRQNVIGHLLSDVVTDHGKWISSTNRFLTLNLSREIYKKPCEDEAIDCDTSSCSSNSKYCQRTCNKCSKVNGAVGKCAFDAKYAGSWLEKSYRTGQQEIKFNGSIFESHGASYSCLNLLAGSWMRTEGRTILTSTFTNGCKPRFTCVELKMTSSSVVQYRVSQSIEYKPYIGSYDICAATQFKMDPYPLFDKYRSAKLKGLVRPKQQRTTVTCNMPGTLNVTMDFNTGDQCFGSLSNCETDNSTMALNLQNCSGHPRNLMLRCLGSFKVLNRVFLITDYIDEGEDLWCWVYDPPNPSKNDNKISLLLAGDCNAETAFNVQMGKSKSYVANINYGLLSQGNEDCDASSSATKKVSGKPNTIVPSPTQSSQFKYSSSTTLQYSTQRTQFKDTSYTKYSTTLPQSSIDTSASTSRANVNDETTLFSSTTTEPLGSSGSVSTDTTWFTNRHDGKNKHTSTVVPSTKQVWTTKRNIISTKTVEISRHSTTKLPTKSLSEITSSRISTINHPTVTETLGGKVTTIPERDVSTTVSNQNIETSTREEKTKTLSHRSQTFTDPIGSTVAGLSLPAHTTVDGKTSPVYTPSIEITGIPEISSQGRETETLPHLSPAMTEPINPISGSSSLSMHTTVTKKISTVNERDIETTVAPETSTPKAVHTTVTEKILTVSEKDTETTVIPETSTQNSLPQTPPPTSHVTTQAAIAPTVSGSSLAASSSVEKKVTTTATKHTGTTVSTTGVLKTLSSKTKASTPITEASTLETITRKHIGTTVLTAGVPKTLTPERKASTPKTEASTAETEASTRETQALSQLSPTVTQPIGPTVSGPALSGSPTSAQGGPSFVGRPSIVESTSAYPGPQASVTTPPLSDNFQTTTVVSAPSSEMTDTAETPTTNNVKTTGPPKQTTPTDKTTTSIPSRLTSRPSRHIKVTSSGTTTLSDRTGQKDVKTTELEITSKYSYTEFKTEDQTTPSDQTIASKNTQRSRPGQKSTTNTNIPRNSEETGIVFKSSTIYHTRMQTVSESQRPTVKHTASKSTVKPPKEASVLPVISPTQTTKRGDVTSACGIAIPLVYLTLFQILLIQILKVLR